MFSKSTFFKRASKPVFPPTRHKFLQPTKLRTKILIDSLKPPPCWSGPHVFLAPRYQRRRHLGSALKLYFCRLTWDSWFFLWPTECATQIRTPAVLLIPQDLLRSRLDPTWDFDSIPVELSFRWYHRANLWYHLESTFWHSPYIGINLPNAASSAYVATATGII